MVRQTAPILPMVAIVVLAAASPTTARSAFGAGRFTVAPAPQWVEPVAFPEATESAPQSGGGATYVELLDFQDNETLAPPESYRHVGVRVLNEQGVAPASQVSISFDPTFQALVLHMVRVHRGGQVLNRLVPDKIKVIQRERRLEYQIYDGRLTALLLLEDVRVGDRIEYSYTLKGANAAITGQYDEMVHVASDEPIGRFERRLVSDPSRPLTIRKFGDGPVPDPRIEERGKRRLYIWSVVPVPVVEAEESLPPGYDPFPGIQITSIRSWSEVADWGAELYRPPAVSSALRAKIDEIRSATRDPEGAVLAAIRFVQDDVRYLGIELGTASHRPSDPGEVLRRRFGDCKDKALLLVTVLRSLGVAADVALVSTSLGREVVTVAPSRTVFDHVIVCLEYEGRRYWIDPTLQCQRGNSLSRLSVPPFGYGLVLRRGVSQLEPIASTAESRSLITIEKNFDAAVFDAPAKLVVQTTYHGAAAEDMRLRLRSATQDEIRRSYLEYYERSYPGIQSEGSLEISDDEQLNLVKTVESYSIPEFWKRLEKQSRFAADLEPIELASMIPQAPKPKRRMPLMVRMPRHVVVSSRLHMGDAWSTRPDSIVIRNRGFRFEAWSGGSGKTLFLWDELERLDDSLPAGAAPAYARDLAKLADAVAFTALSDIKVPKGEAGINWLIVLTLLIVLGGSSAGAMAVYRYRLVPTGVSLDPESGATLASSAREEAAIEASPPPPDAASLLQSPSAERESGEPAEPADEPKARENTNRTRPIGGWLWLLGFGLLMSPVAVVVRGYSSFRILERGYWIAAIHTEGGLNASTGALLVFEAIGNTVLIVCYALLLVMFAKRRRSFPRIWIVVMVFSILLTMLDLGLTAVNGASNSIAPKQVRGVMWSAIMTFVWGAYLTRSRRARETFVL